MNNNHQPHLVIVDALNLIRRIDGALRGFASQSTLDTEQLLNLTQQAVTRIVHGHYATHVIAVFDGDGNNWRKQIYPAYKENRKPMASDLAALLPQIQQQWCAIGVQSLLTDHEEADDLIATLAVKMTNHAGKVTIVSTDQGFSQLLSLGVNVWDHFNSEWLTAEKISDKLGVKLTQLLDYWAIVGQSGNKIPGVSGMGPKAAVTLLQQFPDLASAFAASPDPKNKLLIKLQQHQEQAKLSYRLVKFKTDIPLGFNLKDIRYLSPKSNQGSVK